MSTTTPASTTTARLPAIEVVRAFAGALAQRDIPGAAQLLSPDVQVRALLPRGLVTWSGIPETVDHFEFWLGRFLATWGTATEPSLVEDRVATSWHHDGAYADGTGRHVIEQHAVVSVADDGIDRIDLLCSGFRKVQDSDDLEIERWDAGDLGCSDGLPAELRRHLQAVQAGGVLEVTVRDPAAKEDLPPLTRMMGHAVEQIDELPDGRLVVRIRRDACSIEPHGNLGRSS